MTGERYTRVYTGPHGRVAHLLPPLASPNSNDAALCGKDLPEGRFWHGTGGIWEERHAARLPLCGGCRARR